MFSIFSANLFLIYVAENNVNSVKNILTNYGKPAFNEKFTFITRAVGLGALSKNKTENYKPPFI